MAKRGYLSFVLHAHLPYVLGHGTWPHGQEWLWEAAAETYLPLAQLCRALKDQGLRGDRAALTIGMTPVLAEMLADRRFRDGFPRYLQQKVDAAEQDVKEFEQSDDKRDLVALACWWQRHYAQLLATYAETLNSDLLGAFRQAREHGVIDVLGGPATHCYSPLLTSDEQLELQYAVGRQVHERLFGHTPAGVWIPECAYRPAGRFVDALGGEHPHRQGLEKTLAAHGFRYTIVDSHLIEGGALAWSYGSRFRERNLHGTDELPDRLPPSLYRPHWIGDGRCPVSVFARDPKTGVQVWSGEIGYPGDGRYLEFHKRHSPGGHRYWRVTDPRADLWEKQSYEPAAVEERLKRQAHHFVELVEDIVRNYAGDGAPVVCAPYDAELFGHWWFEGPRWLERVILLLSQSDRVRTITPANYLKHHEPSDRLLLPAGSWGDQGDHRSWRGPHADGYWRRIARGERRLWRLLDQAPADAVDRRIQNQAVRTFLLLQASDWPFLLYTRTAGDYAERRIELHFLDLEFLLDFWQRRRARSKRTEDRDLAQLGELEQRDAVFPEVDVRNFRRRQSSAAS